MRRFTARPTKDVVAVQRDPPVSCTEFDMLVAQERDSFKWIPVEAPVTF